MYVLMTLVLIPSAFAAKGALWSSGSDAYCIANGAPQCSCSQDCVSCSSDGSCEYKSAYGTISSGKVKGKLLLEKKLKVK